MSKEEFTPDSLSEKGAVSLKISVESMGNAHERAKEIAGWGDYDLMRETLINEGFMVSEVQRVQEKYKGQLEEASWITEGDWEMLTILDCFDETTANHCVETYRIAKDRIERFNIGEKKFINAITEEGVNIEEFYRACLFHDIGKCCIPRSILNNTLTNQDFTNKLCQNVGNNREVLRAIEEETGVKYMGDLENTQELEDYLGKNKVHAMRFVPIVELLSPEEQEIIVARFPHIDLPRATLADLITPHEEESEKILASHGFFVEASIAGRHHNYRNLPIQFPVASGTLGMGSALVEILTLSDMEQALTANRSYKKGMRMLSALRIIIAEAQRRNLNPLVITSWISQELTDLENKEGEITEEDKFAVGEIRNYILKHKNAYAERMSQSNLAK